MGTAMVTTDIGVDGVIITVGAEAVVIITDGPEAVVTVTGRASFGAESEEEMTAALSAMGYPHWLIVAGADLLVLGFIGLALRRRSAPVEPTEASDDNEQRRAEFDAEITKANRKAKLAEQTKDRWANEAKPPPPRAAKLDK